MKCWGPGDGRGHLGAQDGVGPTPASPFCAMVVERGRSQAGGERRVGIRAEEFLCQLTFHKLLMLKPQARWRHSMDGNHLELLGDDLKPYVDLWQNLAGRVF